MSQVRSQVRSQVFRRPAIVLALSGLAILSVVTAPGAAAEPRSGDAPAVSEPDTEPGTESGTEPDIEPGTEPDAEPDAEALAEAAAVTELLVDWNRSALALAEAEDGFLTLKGLRTAAMMHLAIHDALNAIRADYAPYAMRGRAPAADPLAAAAEAAHRVVASQYPDAAEELAARHERWLERVPDEGPGKADGREIGAAAAAAILDRRQGDRWDGEAEYQWHPMAPGVYAEFREHSGTPEGFVFGAGWAEAKPFVLTHPSQFRVPPPPATSSDAYTRAFREVKAVGSHDSATRTADQTHMAMWWKDFAENSHNRLARKLVAERDPGPWAAARLFALLNMAIYDGYLGVFENKFHYNHWRPYTAIRWAADDDNPDTEADPEWDNLHRHTYAFPTYPSAHGTACAAAATVLADSFGDDHAFTMSTPRVDEAGPMSGKIAMDPPTRSFDSFSAAAEECALSRVYLGIHFRYDSTYGTDLGNAIGGWVVEKALTRLDGGDQKGR